MESLISSQTSQGVNVGCNLPTWCLLRADFLRKFSNEQELCRGASVFAKYSQSGKTRTLKLGVQG
ncbi:hypothetical protein PAMC26577_21875 [Caballeronia sordidicola]|uniref:Uncharacterized protein n=1 Tax=Caballeronia sordidicola TaxID=196367 RepID=A0A242MLE3_CABSO|nr:hypothetical protein PAMC26577_21875 [Caballeronia sordidicola]